MSGISPEIIKQLNSYPWPKMMPKFVYYAENELKQYRVYGRQGGQIILGKTGEDFVSETITKIYAGIRKWDPKKTPDLTEFLFMVIKSEIRNLVKSPENKKTVEGDAPLSVVEDETRTFINQVISSIPNPDRQLLEKEHEKMADDFLTGFFEYLEDDSELTAIMQCVWDGQTKKDEIADTLGLDVEVVYNAWKRMRRKLAKYSSSPGRDEVKKYIGGVFDEKQ